MRIERRIAASGEVTLLPATTQHDGCWDEYGDIVTVFDSPDHVLVAGEIGLHRDGHDVAYCGSCGTAWRSRELVVGDRVARTWFPGLDGFGCENPSCMY